MNPVLEVRGLSVEIPTANATLRPVRDVSFDLHPGETLSLVGESGSGKSMTALAIMDLLPRQARRSVKRLRFLGEDLASKSAGEIGRLRGAKIGMVFQDPMTSLNPVYTVGNQLMEVYLRHKRSSKHEARERALFLLDKVNIPDPALRLCQYPHQLSGGLRQRVMIAMALMCGPALIIADEPTTALDVTTQSQILDLLRSLQREFHMAVILITHDLGVVAHFSDRVSVMYAGEIVEQASTDDLLVRPMHPYTSALLDCIPVPGSSRHGGKLRSIPGVVPLITSGDQGCAFRGRCDHTQDICKNTGIPMRELSGSHKFRCVLLPRNHADVAVKNHA